MSVVLAKPGKPVQSVTPVRCAPVAASRWRTPSGRLSRSAALLLGAVLVLLAMVWGAASGAYAIAPAQLPSIGWDGLRSLLGGEQAFWKRPELALTPAFAKKALVTLEASHLLGFGPRLPSAVQALHMRALQWVA